MKHLQFILTAVLAIGMLDGVAAAQEVADQPGVQVMESEEYGEYLADFEGYALYIFVANDASIEDVEPMTDGVRDTAMSCTGTCLDAWPAFSADSDVREDAGVDSEMLYIESFDDRSHAVYNGWPLFYFVQDEEPGQTNGHGVESFGGVWYLIRPDGQHIFVDPAEEAG